MCRPVFGAYSSFVVFFLIEVNFASEVLAVCNGLTCVHRPIHKKLVPKDSIFSNACPKLTFFLIGIKRLW